MSSLTRLTRSALSLSARPWFFLKSVKMKSTSCCGVTPEHDWAADGAECKITLRVVPHDLSRSHRSRRESAGCHELSSPPRFILASRTAMAASRLDARVTFARYDSHASARLALAARHINSRKKRCVLSTLLFGACADDGGSAEAAMSPNWDGHGDGSLTARCPSVEREVYMMVTDRQRKTLGGRQPRR